MYEESCHVNSRFESQIANAKFSYDASLLKHGFCRFRNSDMIIFERGGRGNYSTEEWMTIFKITDK